MSGVPTRPSLFNRLGLDRPELRAWAMYDWAISAVQTTIMVAVFPIYFITIASDSVSESGATQALANAHILIAVVVAVLSPILGAISDYAGIKKKMLAVAMVPGLLALSGMFFVQHGDYQVARALFVVVLISATASVVFYESLLPHIAPQQEMDRVSSAGYALGYLGGGVLLAINLAWIIAPQAFGLPSGDGLTPAQATLPTRLAFVSVAVWWLLFAIPLFRRVKEPPRTLEADERVGESIFITPFRRLYETLRELRRFKNAFLMLVAFMIYNDGIQMIQKMAAAYGSVIGIDNSALITALLIVQFVGVPFAFLFGGLASRVGAKRMVLVGLVVYTCISIFGYFITTATHFFILATLTGMVQGGTQALSRSLFARMIPAHKSGEFFGFYSVFEKFAGIFAPLVFSLVIGATGHPRNAIFSLIVFFVIGAAILLFVDVDEGERVAREAERGLRRARGADDEPQAPAAPAADPA